ARAVGEVGGLLDRQRIHIGPEADRAGRSAGPQPADDPGAANAAKNLTAELREPLRNHFGSPLLLEAELGMGMDIAPPARQIIMKFHNALDDRHRRSLLLVVGTCSPIAGAPTIRRYRRASYWDALLVATAGEAGCTVLLSED